MAAAVEIFAEQGFELATLRDITARAGLNIAAVNYYFGSKEELVRQVLDHLITPFVNARLEALEAAGPGLEAVVEALVRPMVELSRDAGGGRSLVRLILQVRARPRPETQEVFTERVNPVVARFVAALERACPDLPTAEIYWRYNFALGAVMQVLTDSDPMMMRLTTLSGGLCDTGDEEMVIRQLVRFIAGGFRGGETIPASD